MILPNIFLAYLIINGIAFGTLAVVVWVNDRRGNPEPFKKEDLWNGKKWNSDNKCIIHSWDFHKTHCMVCGEKGYS